MIHTRFDGKAQTFEEVCRQAPFSELIGLVLAAGRALRGLRDHSSTPRSLPPVGTKVGEASAS